jgi:curved DNA-binding protein CbpA
MVETSVSRLPFVVTIFLFSSSFSNAFVRSSLPVNQIKWILHSSPSFTTIDQNNNDSVDVINGAVGNTTTSLTTEKKPTPTLYEILGAKPSDTKEEIKKKYVQLAKMSHPDAIKFNGNTIEVDFNEISTAWSILGDEKKRLRYDRSLKAAQFSEDLADWTIQQARPAADWSAEVLEKVAIPFLSTTFSSTLARFQAAAASLQSQKEKEANKKWSLTQAMKAAARAGNAIDKIDLLEKATKLDELAAAEVQKALQVQQTLKQKALERLRLSIHTTDSQLTSSEAWLILESMNQTQVENQVPMTRQLSTLQQHIAEEVDILSGIENDFVQAQQFDQQWQEEYRTTVKERLDAKNAMEQAQREEQAARIAYEQAQQNTIFARERLESISRTLINTSANAKKSSYEVERRSVVAEQQAERVRSMILQSEKALGISTVLDSSSIEENQKRLETLAILRQEERDLTEQEKKMEVRAAKFISRANKLRARAGALDSSTQQ